MRAPRLPTQRFANRTNAGNSTLVTIIRSVPERLRTGLRASERGEIAVASTAQAPANQGASSPSNSSHNSTGPVSRNLTDDEILGLGVRTRTRRAEVGERTAEAAEDPALVAERADPGTADQIEVSGEEMPQEYREVFEANPELRSAWDDARAYRQAFSSPEEARAATRALEDVRTLDRLFYSRRSDDHAQLAQMVAKLDPESFSSLAKAMANVATVGQAEVKEHEGSSAGKELASTPRERAVEQNRPDKPERERFVQAANEDAVRSVLTAIESQVDRVLPGNSPSGARNRLVGEIYRELDASLQANPEFAKQVRQALQSGKLDAGHRTAVVSFITSRARQGLPAAIKRVLGEWTSTVLATTGERHARQRSAENRVDIGGARGSAEAHRARSPRDIDYKRMSDTEILNL